MEIQANQIGPRLKEIRRTLDRTLAQVSDATGVSISNLSKIENRQISPSFDIMKRICDGLDQYRGPRAPGNEECCLGT